MKVILVVFLLVFAGLEIRDALDHSDDLPPITPATTPVYPLGHEPTTCAEYIASNTHHEGC